MVVVLELVAERQGSLLIAGEGPAADGAVEALGVATATIESLRRGGRTRLGVPPAEVGDAGDGDTPGPMILK